MAKYVPSPRDWVREQVELYESSGGTRGTTLRDTGLPVILVAHTGNKTSAVRSQGGVLKDPVWVLNLRANPQIELRDETVVRPMQVREIKDKAERDRLWTLVVAATRHKEYQARTARRTPVFVAEP